MRLRRMLALPMAMAIVLAAVISSTALAQEPQCELLPRFCAKTDPDPQPSPEPSPEPSTDPGTDPGSEPGGGEPGGGAGGGQGPNPGPGAGNVNDREGGGFADAGAGRTYPFSFSGSNSTRRLIKLLAHLQAYGIPVDESIRKVAGPFPVAGPAWWTDDWHAPRSGGRVHQGLDIFAPHGTPLVAAADGVISHTGVGGLCGIAVEITDKNGTQYFYCHLSAHAPGLALGREVKAGQLVGFVGNTGNAIATPSHVHFEYQPGGIPRPPKPVVDAWLGLAERRAVQLLGHTQARQPAPQADLGFRLSRMFDLAGGGGSGTTTRPFVSDLPAAPLDLGYVFDEMTLEIDWPEPPVLPEGDAFGIEEPATLDPDLGFELLGALEPSLTVGTDPTSQSHAGNGSD